MKWKWSLIVGPGTIWIGIGLVPLLLAWSSRRKTRYIITTQRVVRKHKRFSTAIDEYRIADLSQLQTQQSCGERFVSAGPAAQMIRRIRVLG